MTGKKQMLHAFKKDRKNDKVNNRSLSIPSLS